MTSNLPQLSWHNDVRRHFAESLYFCFFSLKNSFNQDEIFPVIEDFLQSRETNSYSFWQIYGQSDIALKAWIPNGISETLSTELKIHMYQNSHPVNEMSVYRVNKTLYDFRWINREFGNIKKKEVNQNDLRTLTTRTMELVKDGLDIELEQSLTFKNLCIRNTPADGLKFFTLIELGVRNTPNAVIENLTTDVVSEVDKHSALMNVCIYEISENSVWVIEGTAPSDNYLSISELNVALNKNHLKPFEARTTTILSSGASDAFRYLDSVPRIPDLKDDVDPHLLLASDESQILEKKGSLEFDVGRYITTGNIEKNKNMRDEILRTIVAFLNSDKEGHLLIGAIEGNRFGKKYQNRLQEFPEISDMRLVGINWDYDEHGWDGYERTLNNLIRDRISASVRQLIDIQKSTIQGRDLCIINVTPAKTEWHYVDDKTFWVRTGGSSIKLEGREQSIYQNEHSR